MQYIEVRCSFKVPKEDKALSRMAVHRMIDQLVIDGVHLLDAQVRVKGVCDPAILEQLKKQTEDL